MTRAYIPPADDSDPLTDFSIEPDSGEEIESDPTAANNPTPKHHRATGNYTRKLKADFSALIACWGNGLKT